MTYKMSWHQAIRDSICGIIENSKNGCRTDAVPDEKPITIISPYFLISSHWQMRIMDLTYLFFTLAVYEKLGFFPIFENNLIHEQFIWVPMMTTLSDDRFHTLYRACFVQNVIRWNRFCRRMWCEKVWHRGNTQALQQQICMDNNKGACVWRHKISFTGMYAPRFCWFEQNQMHVPELNLAPTSYLHVNSVCSTKAAVPCCY